jgi:hypothetical protein
MTKGAILQTSRFDFFLPVKPNNDNRGSDLKRTHNLVNSINRFVDPTIFDKIVIAVPQDDHAEVTGIFSSYRNVFVISEFDIVESRFLSLLRGRGWYLQQVLKLGFARLSQKATYITLDADCLFTSFVTREKIEKNGRVVMTPMNSTSWGGWWSRSASLLGLPNLADGDGPLMGVTPQFLHTQVSCGLIDKLQSMAEEKGFSHWVEDLQRKDHYSSFMETWTEYTLYWTYLCSRYDYRDLYFEGKFYTFGHSVKDSGIRLDLRQQVLRKDPCAVLQSTKISDSDLDAFYDSHMKTTAGFVTRSPYQSIFTYYAEHAVTDAMAGYEGTWVISSGGVRMVALMDALRCDRERLKDLTQYYMRPRQFMRDQKMVYVIVDPADAVSFMIKNQQQINMAKNTNINWPVNFCYGIKTVKNYASIGQDLFDLTGHFDRWYNNGQPAEGQLLFIKYEAISAQAGAITDFLQGSVDTQKALYDFNRLPSHGTNSSALEQDRIDLRDLYQNFSAKLDSLPDFFIL